MTIKYTEPCNVADSKCTNPAGFGSTYGHYSYNYSSGGGAKFMCFCCGMPVCGKCSKIINYLDFGKQRICNICRKENAKMSDKVLVMFYAGDKEEEVDMLELLHMDLDEWNDLSQLEQDKAIDSEHETWMWGLGILGWTRL